MSEKQLDRIRFWQKVGFAWFGFSLLISISLSLAVWLASSKEKAK